MVLRMTPLQRRIEELGGLIKTAELHAFGLGRNRIALAVAGGEIDRIRQGWYANPWLPQSERQAARVGGQLACSAAAEALGLWQPKITSIHVCVEPDARALRSPSSARTRLDTAEAVVHWTGLDPAGSRTVVSVARCVRQIALCESPAVALVVAESALHRGRLGRAEWNALLAVVPRDVHRVLARASARSESGSESVFVHRMAELGVLVRQQVEIPGVGRVDGLIGDRLVVEIDSRRFHPDPHTDRERDAKLSALGYRVLRFMYRHVMEEWPMVRAAVLAAIARGDHLV